MRTNAPTPPRRRRRTTTVIAAAAAVTLGLTACSSSDDSGGGDSSKGSIKVGNVTSITGFAGVFTAFHNGLVASIDYINANGGVKGRKIELTTLDDGGDASKNLLNTKRLLDQGVVAFIGNADVGSAAAGLKVMKPAGVADIASWCSGPECHGQFDNVFPVLSAQYGTKCAPWQADQVKAAGATKVAAIGLDVPAGHFDLGCNIAGLKKDKIALAGDAYFAEPSLADYTPVIQNFMSKGADAIITNVDGQSWVRMTKAALNLGFKGKIISNSAGATPSALKALGTSLSNQLIGRAFASEWTPIDQTSNPTVKLLQSKVSGTDKIDSTALLGWAAGMMLKEVLSKAGTDRKAILDYMKKFDGYTAGGIIAPTKYSSGPPYSRCVIPLVLSKGESSPVLKPVTAGSKFSCADVINPEDYGVKAS